MGEEQRAIVLPTQQFLGFWGIDPHSASDQNAMQTLEAIVEQGAEQFEGLNWIQPTQASSSAQTTWGLVLVKPQGAITDHPISLQTPVIVGASASGLCTHAAPFDAAVQLEPDRLTLQREPFGRFPLYWMQQGQLIWFSSRWQWLVALQNHREISIAAVYGYSCLSYVPTPLTPVTGIANLPAGTQQSWTIYSNNSILSAPTPAKTWNWQESAESITDETNAIAQLQTLLQQAIHSQISDLNNDPVGVFLSGGLDSSIVAALLVQAGLKVRAYTLDFEEVGISEHPYAEQVAEYLNIPLVKVAATPRQIRRALIPTAQALDLPFGDGVTVPLYLLAQTASQEVRTIFNGEGSDQLFAGWTNKPLIAAGIYQTEQPQPDSFTRQYLRTFHRFWEYEAELFQPNVLAQVQTLDPETWLEDALDAQACPSLLHQLRRATLMLKGAQNIHPRATQLGLAHGLNVRSPFCFLPLAQWAFQLTSELHLQGSCEKYILKRAVEPWLPSDIVWRTKRGMGVPLTTWCFNELWHDLSTWLNPAQLRQDGIWQPHIADRIVTGQLGTIQGRRMGECLWLLLMWQIWQRTVLGKPMQTFSLNHPFWLPPLIGQLYCRLQRRTHS
ncbi:MAG: asparagine synthetase B family protein [Leptolyngbyaceae cyanobacterium bins.302]|nr:asparagine synthetase B family protein [Leptolyngbyaceae cyanobacterium bins.302]